MTALVNRYWRGTEVTVLGAGGGVRAEGAVPAVAGVAVGVAGVVDPAPVGVKRHPGLNCAGDG